MASGGDSENAEPLLFLSPCVRGAARASRMRALGAKKEREGGRERSSEERLKENILIHAKSVRTELFTGGKKGVGVIARKKESRRIIRKNDPTGLCARVATRS